MQSLPRLSQVSACQAVLEVRVIDGVKFMLNFGSQNWCCLGNSPTYVLTVTCLQSLFMHFQSNCGLYTNVHYWSPCGRTLSGLFRWTVRYHPLTHFRINFILISWFWKWQDLIIHGSLFSGLCWKYLVCVWINTQKSAKYSIYYWALLVHNMASIFGIKSIT